MQRLIASASEEFASQAEDELRRAAEPVATQFTRLPANAILLTCDCAREALLKTLRERPPVFVRHIFPVDVEVALSRGREDLPRFVAAVEPLLLGIPAGTAVAIQARRLSGELEYTPYAIKEALDPLLTAVGLTPTVKEAEWVISLALADDHAYLGVSRVSDNLSDWAGGMMRFRAEDDDISRSKRKLLEALAVFAIDLSEVRTALDLGAAPGGWTSALIERGIAVTAVDTGLLDERLLQSPLVTFIQSNAESLQLPPGRFDLMTSDISWDPLHTATMIVRLSQFLRAGGLAVVTVKLMHRRVWPVIEQVRETLSQAFEVIGARHLFHNRREITLLLRRKKGAPPSRQVPPPVLSTPGLPPPRSPRSRPLPSPVPGPKSRRRS